MKNKIKNLLLTATILLGGFAFTEVPAFAHPLVSANNELGVLPIGGAYAVFAGQFGGEISTKMIATHDQVNVEGCAKGSRIFKFTLRITSDGKTTSFQSSTGELSKAMLAKLRMLSAGDEFVFQNMKAYLPNGKDVVDVHGRTFRVV